MRIFCAASSLDLPYRNTLVALLVIILFLCAKHVRTSTLAMADTIAPQTPSRKLFKPSRKTKTPTPGKRQRSTTSTPSAAPDSAFKSTPEAPQLSQSPVLQSAESLRSPGPEDLAKSTNLAPLVSTPDPTSNELAESLGGDKTGNTPTGLADKNAPTPTDSGRRSTETTSSFSKDASRTLRRRLSSFKDKLTRTKSNSKPSTPAEPAGASQRLIDSTKSISEKSKELLGNSKSDLPTPANPTDIAKPGADIATYFTEHGNPEMSDFVKALVNTAEDSRARVRNSSTQTPPAQISDKATGALKSEDQTADTSFAGQELNLPAPEQISKMAERSPVNGKNAGPGIAPKNINTTKNEVAADGTRYIDNMGEPAHIKQSIEIPLPQPERVVNSPPRPGKLEENLPSTNDLASPDDLPEIPDDISEDRSEDPPEEVLDPSVHSTSANITPIPKIPKIPSINSPPPPDLSQLARGLNGHIVDDVGNVVDESGKVLGHVTGDLPAMIGKKVASNGEVYGDGGEIIGYVSENFVSPPPPSEIPADVLGGLKVDHEGNILDSDGNAIGRFHQKPGQNGALPPFMKSAGAQNPSTENKPKQEDKPKLTIRIPTTFGRQPPDE
ncbi:hypothetical protein F4810DRAFT_701198 [Camillea tinctor]|nr:hypothetical protein F4810DRAFT_701198 [Camillea tinctor]